MLEKLMAAQERIAELEAAALEIRADCNAVVCGKSDRITELEAEVTRLRVDGARYGAMVEKLCNEPKKDFIVITGRQLKNALEFVAPDCPKDEDQLDTEVCIGFAPERVIDGETLPAGLMVWLAEYPEEGAIPLDDSPDAAKESA